MKALLDFELFFITSALVYLDTLPGFADLTEFHFFRNAVWRSSGRN
jgi:hypothetical protein